MSDQIEGFDSTEWYTVTTMEQLPMPDYLDGNALMDDFKFADSLIVANEDSMQTTSPESLNASALMAVDNYRRGPPDRNIIQNQFNFTVEINSNDTNKKKYLYSHRLNRIYVDKECDFSVQFNWASSLGDCMRVRACLVFADEAQAQKRPECCLQHLHQGNNTALDKHIGLNILHSSRPMGTAGVEYHGSALAADSWLSTVVSLTKPGPEPVAHAYKFLCKSSCSSGINRRAIAIIFTLEDSQGMVHGRQMVGARVCSCPKRDMLKDEESEGVFRSGKKRALSNNAPKAKKIKVEVVESEVRTVPELEKDTYTVEVIGKRAALAGFQCMVTFMEEALAMRRPDKDAASYEEAIAKLKRTIQDIVKNLPPTNAQ